MTSMMQATHPRDPGSEDEARKVIEAFLPLFSRLDVRGLLSVVNFPRIRVTGSRTVIMPSANEWTGDPVVPGVVEKRKGAWLR